MDNIAEGGTKENNDAEKPSPILEGNGIEVAGKTENDPPRVPSTIEFMDKKKENICENTTCDGTADGIVDNCVNNAVQLSPDRSSISPLGSNEDAVMIARKQTEHPLVQTIRHSSLRSIGSLLPNEDPPATAAALDVDCYGSKSEGSNKRIESGKDDEVPSSTRNDVDISRDNTNHMESTEEQEQRDLVAALEAEAEALAKAAEEAITKAKLALQKVNEIENNNNPISSAFTKGIKDTIALAEREAAAEFDDAETDMVRTPTRNVIREPPKIIRQTDETTWNELNRHVPTTMTGKPFVEINPADVKSQDGTQQGSDEGREPKELSPVHSQVTHTTGRILSMKDDRNTEVVVPSPPNNNMAQTKDDLRDLQRRLDRLAVAQSNSRTNFDHVASPNQSPSTKIAQLTPAVCHRIDECNTKLSNPKASVTELMDAADLIEKLVKVVVAIEPIEARNKST